MLSPDTPENTANKRLHFLIVSIYAEKLDSLCAAPYNVISRSAVRLREGRNHLSQWMSLAAVRSGPYSARSPLAHPMVLTTYSHCFGQLTCLTDGTKGDKPPGLPLLLNPTSEAQ